MNLTQLIKDHETFTLIELTEKQSSKLKGLLSAGCKVFIHWRLMGEDVVDEGYAFELPGMDGEYTNDFFIHVPSPRNPGGIGDGDPEWRHINDLLKNGNVKKITL